VTGEVVYVTQNWLAIELNRGSCNSRRQLSAWQSRGTGAGLVLVVEVESVVELGEVVGIIVTVISSVVEVSNINGRGQIDSLRLRGCSSRDIASEGLGPINSTDTCEVDG
jgi:hypothetical protein